MGQAEEAHNREIQRIRKLSKDFRHARDAKRASCKKGAQSHQCEYDKGKLTIAREDRKVARKDAKCPTIKKMETEKCQRKRGKGNFGETGEKDECINMLEDAPTALGMYYKDSTCGVVYEKSQWLK